MRSTLAGPPRWDGQAWVEQSAWSELPPIWGRVHWAIGHDDTVWLGNAQGLYSFDAANGTWLRHEPVSGVAEIDVAPDGTVWVRRDPRWPTMTLGQDEGSLPSEPDALLAIDGKAWTAYELPRTVTDFDIGPDGTVWAISNPNATIGFEGDTYKGRVNYSEEDWSDIYAIVRDG